MLQATCGKLEKEIYCISEVKIMSSNTCHYSLEKTREVSF